MFLMIDNYDSFVYNLVRYMEELNECIEIFRNDAIDLKRIKEMQPEGIIISPGPGKPESAGISEAIVRRFGGDIPILGICLGHQVIAHVYGSEVIKGEQPVHGKVHGVTHKGTGLFERIPSPFNVTRYHSLIVDRGQLGAELDVTCETQDGVIMGIRHQHLPVFGVQFHPEAQLTEYGHELLSNFVRMSRQWSIEHEHNRYRI